MFIKVGDYFTRFYASRGNREKYGSIWYVIRVIRRSVDEMTVKQRWKFFEAAKTVVYSEYYLSGERSLGNIRKSTCNEIFCYINLVIRESRI